MTSPDTGVAIKSSDVTPALSGISFEEVVDAEYEDNPIIELPTLYSCNHAGKKMYWWMELDEDKHRTNSKTGEKGKVKTTGWTTCESKNVGRSNETTPEDQAKAEAKATYTKKLKNHYHFEEDQYTVRHYLEPMLAQTYAGDKDKIWLTNSGVITQPKLDGFRCILTIMGAFSRKGEEFVAVPHILESLHTMFENHPNVVLDGELYNHELKDDFDELSSIIRKEKVTEEDLQKSRDLIKLYVYDIPSAGLEDYIERYASIGMLTQRYPSPYIEVVETNFAQNHATVRIQLEDYLQRGYEGLIIRLDKDYIIEGSNPKDLIKYDGYEIGKRSQSLKKYKLFKDEEFELIAILAGKGSWSEYAKKVIVRLEDGQECDAGIKGNFAFCKKLIDNKEKYIGKQVTIRYFVRTPKNKLRMGVATKFHLKDKA